METLEGTSKDLEYLLIAVFAHFVQTLDYYLQTFFQMLFNRDSTYEMNFSGNGKMADSDELWLV